MSAFDRAVGGLLPLVPKPIVGYFSRRYIAGSTTDDALACVRRLNGDRIMATLDVLGESVSSKLQAAAARDAYLHLLDAIQSTGAQANISIKPTQFGLNIDPEACFDNFRQVVSRAQVLGSFVRIDMEDSSCTAATLELHQRLRAEHSAVGVVLQAMLRRTADDAAILARTQANVRLCKGIYLEPRRCAYQDRDVVRRNYVAVLEELLRAGCYVGIATHDEYLVWEALNLVRRLQVNPARYEFQMLLGVDEELRRILVDAGQRLRVYVPFGKEWYAYSLRRLRENPRVAGYVVRGILHRRYRG